MWRALFEATIRGLARELAMNPRNLRIEAIIDGEENLLARIDAAVMKDVLNRAGSRVLRIRLGNVAYDIDLGTRQRPRSSVTSGPKQRGFKGP